MAGKLTTILYAIVGIPLLGLFLSKLGNSEANLVRYVYAKLCCGCWEYKGHSKLKGANFKKGNESLSSDGFGSKKSSVASYKSGIKRNQENEIPLTESNSNTSDMKSTGYENGDKPMDYSRIRVPISLTLFILTTYVMLGGVLFMLIEGDYIFGCMLLTLNKTIGSFCLFSLSIHNELISKNYFENVINYSHLITKKCLNKFKLNLLNFYVFFGFYISFIQFIQSNLVNPALLLSENFLFRQNFRTPELFIIVKLRNKYT